MATNSIWTRIRTRVAAMGLRDSRRIAALPRYAAKRLRRYLSRVTLIGLTASAFFFAINLWGAQDRVCSIAIAQDAASDICGAIGIGHKPTRAERLAWVSLPPGDCKALENFARKYGQGTNGPEATQRILLRRVVRESAISQYAYDAIAPGYARQSITPFATQNDAEAGARQEAIKDATERYCAPSDPNDRLVRVELTSFTPVCTPHIPGFGIRCGADYHARCVMVGHKPREWCGAGAPR